MRNYVIGYIMYNGFTGKKITIDIASDPMTLKEAKTYIDEICEPGMKIYKLINVQFKRRKK